MKPTHLDGLLRTQLAERSHLHLGCLQMVTHCRDVHAVLRSQLTDAQPLDVRGHQLQCFLRSETINSPNRSGSNYFRNIRGSKCLLTWTFVVQEQRD